MIGMVDIITKKNDADSHKIYAALESIKRSVNLISLYGLVSLFLNMLLSFIVSVLGLNKNIGFYYLSTAVITVTAIFLPALWLSRFGEGLKSNFIDNKKTSIFDSVCLIIFGFGACIIINAVISAISAFLPGGQSVYKVSFEDTGMLFIMLLSTAVVPAICEEAAFRGFVMQNLKKFGWLYSAFISSLIFGLMHSGISTALFAFTSGMLLAYLRGSSGRLAVSIVVHFLNNALALFYIAVSVSLEEKIYNSIYFAILAAAIVVTVISYIILSKHNLGFFTYGDNNDQAYKKNTLGSGKKLIYTLKCPLFCILILIMIVLRTILG